MISDLILKKTKDTLEIKDEHSILSPISIRNRQDHAILKLYECSLKSSEFYIVTPQTPRSSLKSDDELETN
jgi:hypothetical protein